MANMNFMSLCLQYAAVGILGNCIGLTVLGISVYVALLCTKYYMVVLLYLCWCAYDYETCENGSRRSLWLRNWWLWNYFRDYFPIKLVKTTDLDPNKNYMFGVFPHGIIPIGVTCNFGCEHTDCRKLFPGLIPHIITTRTIFLCPIIREMLLAVGSCVPTERSISNILSHKDGGHVAVLMPGGSKEAAISKKGQYKINLKKRKGFIRLAIKHGSPVVPVISFGENDTYDNFLDPDSSIAEWIFNNVAKPMKLSANIPNGKFLWLPNRVPITTVVGNPILVNKLDEPTEEDINKVHAQFIVELTHLFETEKHKYIEDSENICLEII